MAADEVLHFAAKNSRVAADHYEGVWARFHHNAASSAARSARQGPGRSAAHRLVCPGSLLKSRIDAEGDIAGVLGQYQVIHGSAESRDADAPQVLNIWNMVTS
jgi:hypothetical protein